METEVSLLTLFYLSSAIWIPFAPSFLDPEVFPELMTKKFSVELSMFLSLAFNGRGFQKNTARIRLFIANLSDGAKWGL